MTTAGNSTAAEAAYEGGARAGGKFRKRPFRKHQTTPYDRPPTAHRIPQRYGWLSKVVDPASKLITYTANRILGSVFRKPLLPSTQHSLGQIRNARDNQTELPLTENHSAVCEQGNRESQNPNNSFNSNGVTELEHMLKQKTFTRSEIDRLAAVLHSKAADGVLGDQKEKCEVKLEGPLVNCAKQKEVVSGSIEANGSFPLISPGMVSTPATGSRDLRDAAASPAELAKAYMFERSVNASASFMGSQSQAHRGDLVALSDVPFHQGSPSLSLAPKARNKVGISDNGFLTPRPRGRSAIYSMARTPYSRVHSTTTYKGAGAVFDPHNETNSSTSSQKAGQNVQFNESKKLVLKRRSSVLESDIGAVGPIRRIRQKPNLLCSKSLGVPALGASIVPQGQSAVSDGREGKIRDYVSSQSIEMGKKILETLETLTPPKEKPSLKKLDIVEGDRPIEMTPNMLRGQALKSLEKDSFEGFVSVRNDSKTPNLAETTSHRVLCSSYNRQDTDADKTAEMLLVSSNKSDTKHGDNGRFLNGNPLPNAKTVVSNASVVTLDAPKKRQAFQMSAHEDFLELDDDRQPNEMGSTSLNEGGEQLKNSFAEGKASACLSSPPDSGTLLDKPEILPKPNLPSSNNSGPESTLLNKNSLVSSSNHTMDGRGTDFTLPRSLGSSSAVSDGAKPAVAVSEVNNVALPQAAGAAPVFSFGLKSSEKVSPVGFQSQSSAVEVSRSKNVNLESSTSFADNTSAVFAVFKAPGADAKADNAAKEDVNLSKKSENGITLLPGSISSTSPVGIMNTTGTPKNGSLGSVFGSSAASSSALVSSAALQTLDNGILQPPSTSATIATAADSSTFAAGSASFSTSSAMGSFPSFSAGSVFAFGSSVVTSTSNVSSTSVVKSSDPGSKNKDSAFANQTVSAGSTPANAGSGLFSFSLTSSDGDGKQQTSNVSEPVSGVQSPAASTLFASATQSMPCHLVTSDSIPAVGASVSSTSSSGSSVFGSFATSSTALASSSGVSSTSSSSSSVFGPFAASSPAPLSSSSGSSSLAQSVSGSSGTVSGLFGSSCKPAIGTSLASGFNSSLQPAGFNFGASSGSDPASNSTPSQSSGFVFGASSGPASNSAQTQATTFSFGVSSCSGSASKNAPMVFGSSGSSSGSVFSFTSAVSTTTPTPTVNFSTAPASQRGFGSSSAPFAFGSPAPSGSNDQMNMEDSMAEDSVQASTPPVQVFGQPPMSQPSTTGFPFPTGGNPFQFGAQQSQMVSQNPSPFQPSNSLDFSAGGSSFSLGTGSTDKSNRRIVKVKSKFRRK